MFEFEEVRTFTDSTKEEIISTLTDLKKEAKEYEDAHPAQVGKTQPVLAIAVIWIGHKLQASIYAPHKEILAKLSPKDVDYSNRDLLRIDEYGLGVAGKPINLSVYASEIVAGTKNTHVLLLEDFSTGMRSILD